MGIKIQHVEIDESAWNPVPVDERLDAYYAFRDQQGDALVKETAKEKKKVKFFIPADTLGSLPEIATMSIAERYALFHPKTPQQIAAEREAEAKAAQLAAEKEAELEALAVLPELPWQFVELMATVLGYRHDPTLAVQTQACGGMANQLKQFFVSTG